MNLWHGNDYPPPDGARIEYILKGILLEGTYSAGYVCEGEVKVKLRMVSQWRLA